MSALPKAVRKKIRDAEKVHEQVYGNVEGKPTATAPEVVPDAPAAPEAVSEQPKIVEASLEVGETTPETPASNSENPTDPPAATSTEQPEPPKWEQRYKVIEGKYRAEVPRLQARIKELGDQVTQLQSTLSTLEKVGVTEKSVTPTPTKLLKDEEIADYGEDLISVVKRAAREEMSPEVVRLQEENTELRRQMDASATTNASNARQSVYDTLNEQVPNWQELNLNSAFLSWLDTPDAYTNQLRRELLDNAFESNDAARVIAFFKGYLKENAVVDPPATGEQPPASGRQPNVDMTSLAAPGKPKGGAAPGTQEGQQTWRQAEISAFYADVRRGKFKNDPATKLKFEKSIMAAVKSNRIVA